MSYHVIHNALYSVTKELERSRTESWHELTYQIDNLRWGYEQPGYYEVSFCEWNQDAPTKITWKSKEGKPRTTSFSKWLKALQPTLPQLTDKKIEILQDKLTQYFNIEDLSYEIVYGRDVHGAYSYTIAKSCMTGHDALGLYEDNPDKVGVMLIKKENSSTPIGRALVWNLDDGSMFLDRVYPSDGGRHIRYAEGVAKKAGWHYKTDHTINGDWEGPKDMQVTLRDVDCYPYMDTLYMARPNNDGTFTLSSYNYFSGGYTMQSTENMCPWDRNEVVGETRGGDEVRESDRDDYVWDVYGDYLIHVNDVVEPINTRDVFDVNHLPDRIVETWDAEFIDTDYPHDYQYVTWGRADGYWVYMDDTYYHEGTDTYVHVDDEEEYCRENGDNDSDEE